MVLLHAIVGSLFRNYWLAIPHMWLYSFAILSYLDNYLYWFRWLELGTDLAFDKRVEQMIVSACQKSNSLTVETIRSA